MVPTFIRLLCIHKSFLKVLHQALAIEIAEPYKQSPRRRTNAKLRVLKPAEAGFVCVAPDFQSVGDNVQDLSIQKSFSPPRIPQFWGTFSAFNVIVFQSLKGILAL